MSCVESYVETLSNALSTDEIVALQQKLEADIDSRRVRIALSDDYRLFSLHIYSFD